MDIGSILLGLALLALVAFIVLRPLFDRRVAREKNLAVSQLAAEREGLLMALRDLDFDHATGKITDEDYLPQRAQLVAQGVAILKQLDAEKPAASGADALEAEIRARRRAPAGIACPQCGTVSAAADQFCAKCGAALSKTCPQCGRSVGIEDKFCAKCGHSF